MTTEAHLRDILARLLKARDEDCPCCPTGSDELWDEARLAVGS